MSVTPVDPTDPRVTPPGGPFVLRFRVRLFVLEDAAPPRLIAEQVATLDADCYVRVTFDTEGGGRYAVEGEPLLPLGQHEGEPFGEEFTLGPFTMTATLIFPVGFSFFRRQPSPNPNSL